MAQYEYAPAKAQGLTGEDISTDVITGANNVDEALGVLDDAIATNNDHIAAINGKLKFGTFEGVTLPYTTTTDGFLTIWLNPSTTSGAYARLKYSADGKNISMGLNAKSGDSVSLSYPVKKGATITQEALTNGSLALNFLPIF